MPSLYSCVNIMFSDIIDCYNIEIINKNIDFIYNWESGNWVDWGVYQHFSPLNLK